MFSAYISECSEDETELAHQNSHRYTSITELIKFDATCLRTKPSVIRA
jgi:hypothetical protein